MKNAIEVVVLLQWKDQTAARDVLAMLGERRVPRRESEPAAIATEMKERVAYLRSRPMSRDERLQKEEVGLLAGADALELRARTLELERRLGKCGPEYQGDLAKVQDLAFAVRESFTALVEAADGPWPLRAKREGSRAGELAAIERFLAAKSAKTGAPTGTEGK